MFAYGPTTSLVLKAPDPWLIRSLIPQSRTIVHPDFNIDIHHTLEACRVLRNLGYNDVPNPPYNYPGKHTPYAHQRAMVEFQVKHQKCFNLSEPGTMKTAATLWAADQLMNEGVIRKCMIFSTLSTIDTIWEQEIFDVLRHRTCVEVHDGGHEGRKRALAQDVDFYVVNHHGLLHAEVINFAKKHCDLIIIDEGSLFREADTDMYRSLKDMVTPRHWCWWLTGGPVPHAPSDAWSQCRIINPTMVPAHFGTFRRMTMIEASKFRWVPRVGSRDMVYAAMQPAIRFEKKDCIDLPPMVTIKFQTTMTKEQTTLFRDMKKDMNAELQGRTLTAVNAADKINKLRQILCGSVRDTQTGKYHTIDHAPRLKTLVEVIEGASAKVIVIVPFKGIIQELARELRTHKNKYTVGVLNGDVSLGERKLIIRAYKSTPDPHILLCHPKVMAHGLELTIADLIAFYGPIYSFDEYSQVIERFNRAGQKNKMTIARIAAHPLEWEIYKMLDDDRANQESIMDLYRVALA